MHRWKNINEENLLLCASAILIAFLIFSLSFWLVFFDHNFYDKEYVKYGTYDALGVEGVRQTTDYLTSYLISENSKISSVPQLSIFTESERSHLEDVHALFRIGKYLTIFAAIGLTIIILRLWATGKLGDSWMKMLRYGAYATAGVLVILLIASIKFDWMFIKFHELFFPQGNYMFAVDSLIKTLFPDAFFSDFVNKVLFHTLLLGLIIYFLGTRAHLFTDKPARKRK